MSTLSATADHYLSEFARTEKSLPGYSQPRIAAMRKAGLEQFLETDFPSQREEDWKYTDVRPIRKRTFECAVEPAELAEGEIEHLRCILPEAHLLVFVCGRFSAKLSRLDPLPSGVTLASLGQAIERGDETAIEHLNRSEPDYANGFRALNDAFMSDGLFLHVKRGVTMEQPIHALFVGTGGEHSLMANARNLVVLEENTEATVLEHYCGTKDALYLTNAVTEVQAAGNARLQRFRVQSESAKAYHVASTHVGQSRDSGFYNLGVDLGARLARTDTRSRLLEPGSDIELYGVYAPNGRQHVDNHTRIDHVSPHGRSREFYRGMVDGHGRGVFNGKIIVHKDAQKTDSEQASNALLLSPNAEVDAKPELEIYADDVKCAHGNTIGQLDEAAIFYLRSRGIDQSAARSLLTYSFAEEIVRHIRLDALRRHVETALLSRLPGGDQIQELL